MTSGHISINDFRRRQEAILSVLDAIRVDPPSGTAALHKTLSHLNDLLLTHWRLQDETFFQGLTAEHEHDPKAGKLLEFFAQDLKDCKIQYLVFFEKYSDFTTPQELKTFSQDFRAFADRMIQRMELEETHLLPLLSV